MAVRAYLDTCIVSAFAKNDLPPAEMLALVEITRRNPETVSLVTSEVTRSEIKRIPEQHRHPHEIMYNFLLQIPVAWYGRSDPGMLLLGVGRGYREDPVFTALKKVLPDDADARHVFQAVKAGIIYFITWDRRTILRHGPALLSIYGIKVVTPSEFLAVLE